MDATADESSDAAVNRIVDVGDERHAPLVGECHHEVSDSFLSPALAHDVVVGVDTDTESPAYEARGCVQEARCAAKGRIPVRLRIGVRARDRIDDWLRRWLIGIADAQVDQIDSTRASGRLQLIEPRKNV